MRPEPTRDDILQAHARLTVTVQVRLGPLAGVYEAAANRSLAAEDEAAHVVALALKVTEVGLERVMQSTLEEAMRVAIRGEVTSGPP